MGAGNYGISIDTVNNIATNLKKLLLKKTQICVVIGGGNIFRGLEASSQGMDRANADYMGMLATVLNGLALQNALEKIEVQTRVMSAFPIQSICETYIRRRAERHIEKGRVIIFAAGTGNPYFTTDTAAALRASEMKCNAMFKATNVDGVYSSDPNKDNNAVRYDTLKYMDVLGKDLKVMDAAAISLARENNVPVIVFSIHEEGAFARVVSGKGKFTIIQ